MAFIGFSVPTDTVRILTEIEVPGEREDSRHLHTTMFLLGKNVPIEDIAKATEVIYNVASKTRPFTMRTRKISSFPPSDSSDGIYPIICPIESEELHSLRETLRKAFDKAKVPYSKTFPDYKPHVTLSFSKEAFKDTSIPPVEWGAHEIILWGGDSGDQRIAVHFPLSLKNRVASIAERYKSLTQRRLM